MSGIHIHLLGLSLMRYRQLYYGFTDCMYIKYFGKIFIIFCFLLQTLRKNLREISKKKNVKAACRQKHSGVFPSRLWKCIFLETLLIFFLSSVHPQLPLVFLQNLKCVQISSHLHSHVLWKEGLTLPSVPLVNLQSPKPIMVVSLVAIGLGEWWKSDWGDTKGSWLGISGRGFSFLNDTHRKNWLLSFLEHSPICVWPASTVLILQPGLS